MADLKSPDQSQAPVRAPWERPILMAAVLLAILFGGLAYHWRPREVPATSSVLPNPPQAGIAERSSAPDPRSEELRRRGGRQEKFARERVELAQKLAQDSQKKVTQVTVYDLAAWLAGERFAEVEKVYLEKTGKPLKESGPFHPLVPLGSGKAHPFLDGSLDAVERAAEAKGLLPSDLSPAERAAAMLEFAGQFIGKKQ